MNIRPERPSDTQAIHAVHAAAFPTDMEARLVDALRTSGRLTVSLVAEADDQPVGHVAFSPVTIAGQAGGLGLAPLAVIPARRRSGVGSTLVQAGLAAAASHGVKYVVVLGDPHYYNRFGFAPAGNWNLRDEYGGGHAFQAIELAAGAIPANGGLVRYAPEFSMFSEQH